MANGNAEAERRQMAISLLAAWRAARDDGRDDVVARRLAAVASEGGLTAVEKAALGLADVAGMLLELYADCAGTSHLTRSSRRPQPLSQTPRTRPVNGQPGCFGLRAAGWPLPSQRTLTALVILVEAL
jgi:hypothetical protein